MMKPTYRSLQPFAHHRPCHRVSPEKCRVAEGHMFDVFPVRICDECHEVWPCDASVLMGYCEQLLTLPMWRQRLNRLGDLAACLLTAFVFWPLWVVAWFIEKIDARWPIFLKGRSG